MNENSDAKNNAIGLIGGTGRCGTSLLSDIFANHPDVATVPEWRFMIDPDGILDYINNVSVWSPYHVDIRIKRLEELLCALGSGNLFLKVANRFTRKYLEGITANKLSKKYLGIDATKYSPNFLKLSDELISKLYNKQFNGYWIGMPFWAKKQIYYSPQLAKDAIINCFSDFYLAVIDDVLVQQQSTHYVEKNTWNILWFDQVLSILPNARMVHIYRDPRDVVASFTQQSWMPSDPILATEVYLDLFRKWQQVKKRVSNDSYLEVSLEQLSAEPDEALHSICDFWGIPWHASLLSKDLSKSNTGRWKTQFSDNISTRICKLLEEPIASFGYE